MKPRVSVITPYRNAKRFLPGFVDSLQSQSAEDWTCIMVDDDSSDGGPAFLAELVKNDPRFQLITNTNPKHWPGPASARNCALALVQTDYVAFCDVDDLWHPDKLKRQLSYQRSYGLHFTVSAYVRFLDKQLDSAPQRVVCPPSTITLPDLLGSNPIPMLTVIISKDLVKTGFSEVAHEDFLFWLDIFKSHPDLRYGCLPEVLAFYRIHQDNHSHHKLFMPLWTYRVFRNFGMSRLMSLNHLATWTFDHLCDRLSIGRKIKPIVDSTQCLLEQPPLIVSQR